MHINNLPVSLLPTHIRSDNDKLVLRHKVPYTSLVLAAVYVGVEIKLERCTKWHKAEEQQEVENMETPRPHQ